MRATTKAILVVAAVAAGALAATAGAAIVVYESDFSRRGEVKEIRKVSGGKACRRSWREGESLLVTARRGPRDCTFRTPVIGDRPGPDHDVKVEGKITKATAKRVRRGAFVAVGVRAGQEVGYRLEILPNRRRWRLLREPEGEEFPVRGEERRIERIGGTNELRLRVVGDRLNAWVNGERVVRGLTDPNAANVDGTRTTLALGTNRNAKKRTRGSFDKLKIRIPNP